jgi:hypothetical protein
LKRRQIDVLVDKLPDAANLSLGALVLGQFVSEGLFQRFAAVAGLALWVFLLLAAIVIAGKGRS